MLRLQLRAAKSKYLHPMKQFRNREDTLVKHEIIIEIERTTIILNQPTETSSNKQQDLIEVDAIEITIDHEEEINPNKSVDLSKEIET